MRKLGLLTISLVMLFHTGVVLADDGVGGEVAQTIEQESVSSLPLTPGEADGGRYKVTDIVVEYKHPHPMQPLPEELLSGDLGLILTNQGYIAPRKEAAADSIVRLSHWREDSLSDVFYASAINVVCERIVNVLHEKGLIGVYVSPNPQDINSDGEDIRKPEGRTSLRLLVVTAYVTELRTLGTGDRVQAKKRINNPRHKHIRDGSPAQPSTEDGAEGDLLLEGAINKYVRFFNRHPGRRVDVSISPGKDADTGGVTLDYIVHENRPWMVYVQLSNTGTQETGEWRERFGLANYQLTGHDDILRLEYVTSGFDQTQSVIASYEAPLFDYDRIRWKTYGAWSEFDASEVGLSGLGFKGTSWSAGAEFAANIYQNKDFFLDLIGGLQWQNVQVNQFFNGISLLAGNEDFFIPYGGLRFDRFTETVSTFGSFSIEHNVASVAGTRSNQLTSLGRTGVEDDWTLGRYELSHAFYLEPALNPKAWADSSTPRSSTLAHEIAMSVRGQVAFNNARLIPQQQQVVGGQYTVRGYKESIAAGDSTVVASLEYRFHLPRIFKIQEAPGRFFGKPFRWAPDRVHGRPDWDLVALTFLDVGRVFINDKIGEETDQTLLGTGVGLELQVSQNVSVSVDWGMAMRTVKTVNAGESRFHVAATLRY